MTDKYNCLYFSGGGGELYGKRWNDKKLLNYLKSKKETEKNRALANLKFAT